MSFSKLFFGTAGIPHSTADPNTSNGVARVRELSLDAMELEFVHSINLTKEKAAEVKKVADANKVFLTCHGPFAINLNSLEKEKVLASRQRILNSAKISSLAGAFSCTFHAGFYMKDSHEKTFEEIKKQLALIAQELKDDGVKISLRPETTGKGSQFGSLEELLEMSSQLDNCLPCIDFSHLHARSGGKFNSYAEFRQELIQCEKALGKQFLHNLHCHVSGINYTAKGERNHLMLEESDLKYKELLRALKEFDCRGVVICESPDPTPDALLLKKMFEGL